MIKFFVRYQVLLARGKGVIILQSFFTVILTFLSLIEIRYIIIANIGSSSECVDVLLYI